MAWARPATAPTLTFQGAGDLFQAIDAGITISLGTISGFSGSDLIKIHSIGAGDKITYSGAYGHDPDNGGTTKIFTFDSSVTASQITLTDNPGPSTPCRSSASWPEP